MRPSFRKDAFAGIFCFSSLVEHYLCIRTHFLRSIGLCVGQSTLLPTKHLGKQFQFGLPLLPQFNGEENHFPFSVSRQIDRFLFLRRELYHSIIIILRTIAERIIIAITPSLIITRESLTQSNVCRRLFLCPHIPHPLDGSLYRKYKASEKAAMHMAQIISLKCSCVVCSCFFRISCHI